MNVRINYHSGLPVYLQIVQQVKASAASGLMRPGEMLPSVRALAEELKINRNTAAKAYSELESEGIIETRPGAGCFLKSSGSSPLRRSVRNERILSEIDALVVQAHHWQIPEEELRRLLDERIAHFSKQL